MLRQQTFDVCNCLVIIQDAFLDHDQKHVSVLVIGGAFCKFGCDCSDQT